MIKGSDGHARGVCVRTQTKTGRSTVLQCPVQLLYPLEINYQPRNDNSQNDVPTTAVDYLTNDAIDGTASQETVSRPQRAAAMRAHNRVAEWMAD